jgi:hypothetical protein
MFYDYVSSVNLLSKRVIHLSEGVGKLIKIYRHEQEVENQHIGK